MPAATVEKNPSPTLPADPQPTAPPPAAEPDQPTVTAAEPPPHPLAALFGVPFSAFGLPDLRDVFEAAVSRSPWGFGSAALVNSRPLGLGLFDVHADIAETDQALEISLEVPGLAVGDLTISHRDRLLIVTGEKSRSSKSSDHRFERVERRYGQFRRVFALPDTAETAAITARLEKGVLAIHIPKTGPAAADHNVEIKAA